MSKTKLEELVDKLSDLTVLEMADLKKALEEKWDVTAAAAAPVAMAAPADGGGDAAAEATEFDVVLEDAGSNKIAVIKVVKEAAGLGLKEAKDVVEGAPKTVKEKAPKAEAEEIKKKLDDAGAKCTLKGV